MSEDTYVAGALTRLLQTTVTSEATPAAAESSNEDAILAGLFAPRSQSELSATKKRKLQSEEDDAQSQAKQTKKQKKQQQGTTEAEEDRTAVKARAKLAKQREQARQSDPRNSRTVFVGNVSAEAKKRELLLLFRAHGPIESARFRSAAPSDAGVVKRLAVIHKKLSRPSLNAYVVFKEQESVAKAVAALNGHCLRGLHLRVDSLLGGDGDGTGPKKDVRKCIFLGNLHFKCDEESVRSVFSPCGRIENVRLVRDSRSGIGRGFGFVQFADSAAVELALRLGGTEIAGRPVRITRCSENPKPAAASAPAAGRHDAKNPRRKQLRSDSGNTAKPRPPGDDRKQQREGKKFDKTPAAAGAAGGKANGRAKRPQKQQQAARPTNRTFAQAFQRMADKRKASAGRKKKV